MRFESASEILDTLFVGELRGIFACLKSIGFFFSIISFMKCEIDQRDALRFLYVFLDICIDI